MKKKRPIKKVSSSKFVYTGKPEELNQLSSGIYAGAIAIIGTMLVLAALYREYVRP
jgi:hypothetical protein